MKKLLALVLALVMTMALAVTSNAAFKDDDKISDSCKEAVDVMNAVGVLIGDNNLNFNPTANLTRAEAAKIISYLLLGNKTAEALVGSNKFSDVAATNWAAGFIDYCAAEKIVNGMGDGTFNPAGQLTGFQFAKMLLGALGYDATIEGFTGTDWEISVSKVAEQAGLFDGLKISGRSVLTREQAAQMCLNTIKAPLVEYSNKGGNISINGAEINIGASKAEYVTTTLAQAQRISKRTLTNTLFTNKGGYTVEFGEKYYSNLYLTADNDAFGRPANTWPLGTKDIGTYTDASTLVLTYENETVKGKDVYSDIGYSAISDYDYEYYLDGVLMAAKENGKVTVKTADDFSKITKSNKDDVFGTGKGVLTQIFVDYDAETVLVVTINTYLAQATADYNAKTEKLPIVVYVDADNATTKTESYRLDVEDFAAIADLKEDDFVKVTKAGVDHQGKTYEIQSIEDVKVVSDVTVASYTTTKDNTANKYYRLDTLNADGTKYDTSMKAYFDASKLYNYNNSLQQLKDATYNLYLDNYDNVLGIKEVKASDQYVFVVGYNDDADEFVEYNTLESAIGALTTEKVNGQTVAYVNEVATICNKTTGYATTLIIYEVKGTATDVKPSDPATKPEATIVNYTINIPSVNGEPVDTVQGVLEKNGYKLETMQSAEDCVATKDGVTYFFKINTSDKYNTLTVNGKVVEYMKGASKLTEKNINATYGATGKGYIFSIDGGESWTYQGYKNTTDSVSTTGKTLQVLTGYVEVNKTPLTGYTVEAPTFVKAHSSFTVTVANEDESEISADTSITVNGNEPKFGGKGVKELSFTVSAENKDVTLTVTASTVYKVTANGVPTVTSGLTATVDGPKMAKPGDTVIFTVTLNGTVAGTKGSQHVDVTANNGVTIAWLDTGAITGATLDGGTLTLPSGAVITNRTLQFSYTLASNATAEVTIDLSIGSATNNQSASNP